MNKQRRYLKFTSEPDNDNFFLFLELKLPIITNNLKHLFIENQLLVDIYTLRKLFGSII